MENNLIRGFNSREEKTTYLADIGEKNIFFSKYIVMLISAFEIAMIIYAVVNGGFEHLYRRLYLAAYIFLLICSVATCVFAWVHENKHHFSKRTVEGLSAAYYIIIVLWAVLISTLDSHNYYQPIVYLTVVMGVTNAVKLRISISIPVQLLSGVLYLVLLSTVAGSGFDVGQSINVIVFVLISVALTLASHNRGLDEFRQAAIIKDNNKQLSLLNAELNDAYEQLKIQASLDPLTGVKNRLTLNDDMERLLQECRKNGATICCAILDVDFFKKVNDTYGHLVGDESLREIADVFRENFDENKVYRFGGEEFVILNSGETAEEFHKQLDAMRSGIENIKMDYAGLELTASIGYCVQSVEETTSCDQLLYAADNALYSAKQKGKNLIRKAQ